MHCSVSAALSAAGNHGGSGPDGVLKRIRVGQASGERDCGEQNSTVAKLRGAVTRSVWGDGSSDGREDQL